VGLVCKGFFRNLVTLMGKVPCMMTATLPPPILCRSAIDTLSYSGVCSAAERRKHRSGRPDGHSSGGHSTRSGSCIYDPRMLSWWTETDLRTDSLYPSDAARTLLRADLRPVGLEIDISTSSYVFFTTAVLSKTSHANCHTTLTNRPSRGRRSRVLYWQRNRRKSEDLAWEVCSVPKRRIKRQQRVRSVGCKIRVLNSGFLLASMPS